MLIDVHASCNKVVYVWSCCGVGGHFQIQTHFPGCWKFFVIYLAIANKDGCHFEF